MENTNDYFDTPEPRGRGSRRGGVRSSFSAGAIALVFLCLGYETALMVHRAAVLKIVADSEEEVVAATVDVGTTKIPSDTSQSVKSSGKPNNSEKPRSTLPSKKEVAAQYRPRELFRFNPNTLSVDSLVLLGFSEKQAQSIDNYRQKGGHFSRKEDFERSYVVSAEMFTRLEPYIDIPRLDINRADSTAFDALPGIGPYFASKMVSYRRELGGYVCVDQLSEIYNFGSERLESLRDLVYVSPEGAASGRGRLDFWAAPEDSLKAHPHIRTYRKAHAIALYRSSTPCEQWSFADLVETGVLSPEDTLKISRILPLQ